MRTQDQVAGKLAELLGREREINRAFRARIAELEREHHQQLRELEQKLDQAEQLIETLRKVIDGREAELQLSEEDRHG